MNIKIHTRRIISMLLVLCMFIGLLPVHAMAAPTVSVDETAANVAKVLNYADQMRKANVKSNYSTGGLTWDTEKKSDSWRYFNGAMLDAFVMVGTSEMLAYAADFYAGNTNSDGSAKNYHAGEVDSVPMALGMFELLNHGTYGKRFAKAIEYVRNQLKNQTVLGAEYGYNYWHKMNSSSWATWKFGLDGLYMADVFEMEYANAVSRGKISSTANVEEIYRTVFNRFEWVANTMRDSSTGLYHHGWNGSTGNGSFWSRGIGWYAVALVDCIDLMPSGSYKQGLIDNLPALFNGMLKYQDQATGMWYNVVNRNGSLSNNKLETSGSAMMAYAMMKAYNKGWVGKTYGEAGLKAFNGVVNNKMSGSAGNYKVSDIYQKSGVGTNDTYYTQNSYVANEAKGTAALIMAATVANAAAKQLAAQSIPEETVPETTVPEETIPETTAPTEPTPEPTVPTEPTPEPTVPEEEPDNGIYETTGAVDAGYVYTLDTDGKIETGSSNRYLIVAANNNVAMYSNGNSKVCGTANVNIVNNTITLDHQNYDWYIKTSGNNKYITHDGTNELYHYWNQVYTNSSKKQNWTIESSGTAGQYRLTGFENWNWRLYYNTSNKDFRVDTGNNNYVRMFKLTSGNTAAEVKFTANSKNQLKLNVGETSAITYNVLVGNAAASSTSMTWSSDRASVATVDSTGKVTAVAPGTTNIRATLTAVNGNTLRESVTLVIPVTVRNHEYKSEVVAPTCTAKGYTIYTCTNCGDNYIADYVNALGHDYTSVVTAPTCTAKGYTTYTCACGDTYVADEKAALGHNYASVVTAPTCTAKGYTTYTCACGDTYVADEKAALGHKHQSVTMEATCTKEGSITYTCACGDTYVETIPAIGHAYNAVVTAPTCTAKGYTTYTCGNCGDSYVADEKAVLGHKHQSVTVEATCTKDGSITYTCACGDTYVETIPAIGHEYSSVVTAPTCTAKGYTTYTCGTCGDSYVADEVAALDHDYTAVITDSTCTEEGYTTYTCSVCGDHYVSNEKAALGHNYVAVVTGATCTKDGYTTHTCSVCGDRYVDTYVDALGHDNVSVVTEATCEKEGYTTHTCGICGQITVDSQVPAMGHDFVFVTVDATCTADGSVTTTCSRCDASTFETIPATGHTYDAVVTAPTCTENGFTTYTCGSCGDTYVADEKAALGHKHESVKVAATCTKDGSITYTCACGDTYTETIPAIGHDYTAVVTAPTCTKGGYTTHTCGNCGDSYVTDEVAALGHDYTSVVTSPTCTAKGYTTYTCGTCGDTYVADEKAALGHDYTSVVTAPTCTAKGYTTYTCGTCGDSYVADEKAALGHDYTSVVTAPTCTAKGYTTYTCSTCGDSYVADEKAALGHKHESVTVDATCTKDGSITYTCACGDTYVETIPAIGHDYASVVTAPTCTAGGYTTYTCGNCGDSYVADEKAALGHKHESVTVDATCTKDGSITYTCACGDTYVETIPAIGHDYASVVTAPTCTEDGYTTYTCSNCGDSYVADEVAALGHDYTAVIVEATCTTDGYTTYTCGNCGDTYTADAVAAYGHNYESVTVDATCTTNGSVTYTCACGDTYKQVIAATGHNYVCVEGDNSLVYTCSHCNDSYVEILENEWLKLPRRYVLDTNGVDIGAQHRYLVVGADQNYALTLSGSTIGASAVTINGNTITLDNASKYEFYFADNNRKEGGSYLLTQDGNKGVYHMGGNIYYGNDNKGYWHFGSNSNGSYQLYDYDNLNWFLNYGYVWGSEKVSRYAVSSTARSVRLYKAEDPYIRLGGKIVQIGTDADGLTEASVLEKISIEISNDGTNVSQTMAVTSNMVTWDNAFDGTTAGTYTGKVIYDGMELGTIKVTLNPKHVYEIVTVAPTCTQQGYTCRQCSVCGTSYVMEYTAALGHSYRCQESDDYLIYTCDHCGDSYSEKRIAYTQVNAFANGSNYVITMYANSKHYALSHANNQLSAVQINVSNGAITTEIYADLLWNYNGNKLSYQSNGSTYYLYSYTNNWWGGWWGNTGATLSISNSNSSTVSFSKNALKVNSNYLRYSNGSISVNSSATTTYLFVEN